VRKEDGERVAMDVQVGDKVLYAKYGGTNIKLDGVEYLILKESDVLAIVQD
jgi:chaperonin GroES